MENESYFRDENQSRLNSRAVAFLELRQNFRARFAKMTILAENSVRLCDYWFGRRAIFKNMAMRADAGLDALF